MKKSMIAITITSMLLASIPAYAEEPIYMAPPGMKIEVEITYDENGRKVITTHCSPIDDETIQMQSTFTNALDGAKKPKPLTEAPKEGVTLGHILNEYASPEAIGWERFTEPYQDGNIGQCTWYARSRFQEVYGINNFPVLGYPKEWIQNANEYSMFKVEHNLEAIPDYSIAVYAPISDKSLSGHVCFIEYIERDENGYPIYVFYSDANGKYDLKKNEFNNGYDGSIIKESFDEFLGTSKLKLVGYISMNNEIEK